MSHAKQNDGPGSMSSDKSPLLVVAFMVWITGIKILCMRSYRSTDFLVHRNWLAITAHLPVEQWYFDNVNGTTVHTLDYPPGFAFFEYILSNNIVTKWMIGNGILDKRCLALLPDVDNEPSDECVVFQRATVVLSDLVLWVGAFMVCFVDTKDRQPTSKSRLTFLFLVLNPGLLWLDHIHFQYNGMLLGVLLLSVGLLIRAPQYTGFVYHFNHVMGAIMFASLLTMKHLYLPLAPLYFVHLLRGYCIVDGSLCLSRFLRIALPTAVTLLVPFLPFLVSNPKDQLSQMLSRLFPFDRGLSHDYWAANVWALYMAANKCLGFAFRKLGIPIQGLLEVTPRVTAVLLLVGLSPGLMSSWAGAARASSGRQGMTLIHAIMFCSFSAFMLAYHAHEKAIMTPLIPMTCLATCTQEHARLFIRTCALALFGLLPLLFRPVELPFKAASYIAFMAIVVNELEKHVGKRLVTKWDIGFVFLLLFVAFMLEVVYPLILHPNGFFEFLPLMLVSVVCALGLIGCWIHSGWLMIRSNSTGTETQ